MSTIEVRPFRRGDREQLTKLVNQHVQAVVPGVSVSVNTVLSQLEREPDEFIVDPWVKERATFVAVERDRLVAAAHLLRYGSGEGVGEHYRGMGEIRWLLCWPPESPFHDSRLAGDMLATACLDRLRAWGATRWGADGSAPAPGVYGVPEQWPHIRGIYESAGFAHEGRTEVILLAQVAALTRTGAPPVSGLTCRRTVGVNGTRFSAVVDAKAIGFIEVEDRGDAARLPRPGGLADVGNLAVSEEYRRRGVARWLLGQAAEWLALSHVDRLLAYAWEEEQESLAVLQRLEFQELTRTARGWYQLPA